MEIERWYAIFVKSGQEIKVRDRLDWRFNGSPSAFVPTREILERKQGRWRRISRVLFPGYIFMKGDVTPEVLSGLYGVPGLFKLLTMDSAPVVIPDAEVEVFLHLMDSEDRIGLSEGFEDGDQVRILSGPLTTMQGEILKIDRRKGRARVRLTFLGEEREIDLGLKLLHRHEDGDDFSVAVSEAMAAVEAMKRADRDESAVASGEWPVDPNDLKDSSDLKDSNDSIGSKDSKDSNDPNDPKDSKDLKDSINPVGTEPPAGD